MQNVAVPPTSKAALLATRQEQKGPAGRTVLACRLRDIRISVGLSVKSAADGAGVASNTILHMERGLAPTLVNALRVADFFGLKIEDIWSIPDNTQ